jgi:glutamyl-tRNA synthetase
VHYFFTADYSYEPDVMTKLKAKPENATLLGELKTDLGNLGTCDEHSIHAAIEATAARLSVKAGALMPLLRFALSGQSRGPNVATIIDLIGKDQTVARIERTLALL